MLLTVTLTKEGQPPFSASINLPAEGSQVYAVGHLLELWQKATGEDHWEEWGFTD